MKLGPYLNLTRQIRRRQGKKKKRNGDNDVLEKL